MLAPKVSRSGPWLAAGCLAFLLGATAAQAINWWPFKKKVAAPPQAVQVLGIANDAGAAPAILQFWDRNTLIIDLQAAGAVGAAALTRPADGRWPRRISFRTLAGQFAVLEVRGEQRAVIPLSATGPSPVLVSLDAAVWTRETAQLELRWGPTATIAAAAAQ